MAKKSNEPQPVSLDAWEDAWQRHWKKVGFGRIVDSPAEAVETVLRSLPAALKEHLVPRRP